jgi:chromosomal replication initiator protein
MLGEEDYLTWVSVLFPVDSDDTSVTVSSDNKIVLDWVRDHLLRDIDSVARSRFGPSFHILLSDSSTPSHTPSDPEPPSITRHPLNPGFTFDSFVIGRSNEFAAAAAKSVADSPGQTYNPLFLYGGAGLGKTHLLHAIAHRFSSLFDDNRVVYTTTEHFVNELINCIRRQKMDDFRQTYREVDVLLLDDIQFISGKERTQEEFFHTFNTLQSTGRQVVFTSDSKPSDLPGLEERLRSRFMQGLISDIQPPDLETRCAILREKSRSQGWDLEGDVALFIARRFQKNVRELEGSLNRSIVFAQLTNSSKLTLDVVRTALSELLPEERVTTPSDIIRFVSQHYGIRVSDIKSRSNRRSFALPRQVAMHLIRHILELSYPEIGKIFGKHHSTAIYALDNVEKIRKSNPDFDATLTSFEEHFSS